MSITFVVEKIHDLSTRIFSTDVVDYICTTTGCHTAIGENAGWGYLNKEVLADFVNNNYIKLTTKESYANEKNAFYLINLSSLQHFKSGVYWNFLNSETLEFLKETKLPILLYYPLEGIGFFTKQDYTNNLKTKRELGLTNKLVILTLSDCRDINNTLFNFEKIDSNFNDLYWIYSTAFFSRYTCPNNNGGFIEDTITFWKNTNNLIVEHDFTKKKYNFLCLNNTPSKNRQILLQELYSRPDLWNNNLISNKFDFLVDNNLENSVNTYKDRLKTLIINEKDYYQDYQVRVCIDENENLLDNQYIEKSSILKFISTHLNKIGVAHYPLRSLPSDDDRARNDNYDLDWYKDTVFTLITETHQWTQDLYMPTPMITEKTVKSIIQRHPFFIFGYANSHRMLQELGFKTFEKVLGLPYDGQLGNLTHLERLKNLVEALENFDKESIDYNLIVEMTTHNYNHLVNTDWRKLQCDLLINFLNRSSL